MTEPTIESMTYASTRPELRLVERVVLHEGPIPFQTLADRVIGLERPRAR